MRHRNNVGGGEARRKVRSAPLILFLGVIIGYYLANLHQFHLVLTKITDCTDTDVSDLPQQLAVSQELERTKSRIKDLERLLEKSTPETDATKDTTKDTSDIKSSKAGPDDDILEGSKSKPDDDVSDNASKETSASEKKHHDNSKNPLNIVLLYADDWSHKTLGAAGNSFVKTPNLDRLARSGVMFSHNCVTSSICWQSRATLYTGQYVSRHKGFTTQSDGFLTNKKWKKSLYSLLTQKGYHTGFFGKWHHNPPSNETFKESSFYQGNHWLDNGRIHVTEQNEKDGLQFLQNRPRGTPFSLTISFFATHALDGRPEQYKPMTTSMSLYENDMVPVPANANNESWHNLPYFIDERNEGRIRFKLRYDTPEKFQKTMKNVYRMATEVDTTCGKIIDELERQGVMNETLVIFTTDNGNYHGEHGLADKWYAHEESIRVPLIVHDPRMPPSEAGIHRSDYTLNIDLAPTILSAAQIQPPDSMQGEDFSQLYMNPERAESWRKEFYYEWHSHQSKTMHFGPFHIPDVEALVRKDYKYIYWPEHRYEQLFHLPTDPLEENDLINATSKRTIVESLRVRFSDLQTAAL